MGLGEPRAGSKETDQEGKGKKDPETEVGVGKGKKLVFVCEYREINKLFLSSG